MKKLLKILLLLSLLLSGCTTKPTYYSKDQIIQYATSVFSNVTYQSSKKSEEGDTIYTFLREDNIPFHIYATTHNIEIDSSTTIFYEKSIRDDYTESIYQHFHDTINSLYANSSLNYYEGTYHEDTNTYSNTQIYITSIQEANQIYTIYDQINQLLNFQYDYDQGKIPSSPHAIGIDIYLKPEPSYLKNKTEYNWKSDIKNHLFTILFSNNKETYLKQEEFYTQVEKALVDHVKEVHDGRYLINNTLWMKYPANQLKTNIQLKDRNLVFSYNQEHQVYSTTLLDPCQDFDSFPYSYTDKGYFKALVEYFGGSYSCDNYVCTWTIQNHTWQAKLLIDSKTSSYQSIEITKDGTPLIISEAISPNGTVSGRNFTVEDLEKMMNVSISIDQKNMQATITYNKSA